MLNIVKSLYAQVLIAIVIGVTVGHFRPDLADTLKPLGDGFVKAIKMVIAPIIFLTVVAGIAGMRDMKKVGRVGAKALLYFEVVTTIALVIGLLVVNLLKPGHGLNVNPAELDPKAVSSYVAASEKPHGLTDFLLNIIPTTIVDAFARGDILQVLFFALLFGFALAGLGARGRPVLELMEELAQVMFRVVNCIMRAAPIGAFGAMAFTVGKYGVDALGKLAFLMGAFYLTCLLFVFVVLGLIAWFHGFSIWRFLVYIREELLLVLGTSSSESALPRLMEKLERLGCSKSVVGLVVPTGYSFNLDGTSIYLTMATVFIAQACNIQLSLWDQMTALGILLLTSKGAAGVTGSGFVTLAATLASLHTVPVAGLALIVGIDRFMSEARAITNFIGNGVATIVVSKWEREVDESRLALGLAGGLPAASLAAADPADAE